MCEISVASKSPLLSVSTKGNSKSSPAITLNPARTVELSAIDLPVSSPSKESTPAIVGQPVKLWFNLYVAAG